MFYKTENKECNVNNLSEAIITSYFSERTVIHPTSHGTLPIDIADMIAYT